jgi:hypothetical protein
LPWKKAAFNRKKTGVKLKEETSKCYIRSIAVYGAENWTSEVLKRAGEEWRSVGPIV